MKAVASKEQLASLMQTHCAIFLLSRLQRPDPTDSSSIDCTLGRKAC